MVHAEARGGGVGDGTHEAHNTPAGTSPRRHRVVVHARAGRQASCAREPSDVLAYCVLVAWKTQLSYIDTKYKYSRPWKKSYVLHSSLKKISSLFSMFSSSGLPDLFSFSIYIPNQLATVASSARA